MPRILIVEDDPTQRRALRIFLEKAGHAVVEAGNGREGLRAFEAQPADLVVTDLIMPEMEGVETIRTLRRLSPALPIIAISGGGRLEPSNYLNFAQHFGAARVFEKPLDLAELAAAVAALLGTGGAAPEKA